MNFQEFVCINKGKLITFFCKGVIENKIVVDIFEDYFTTKDFIDGKVEGFYYFSECSHVTHPLMDIVNKYVPCVIIGQPLSGSIKISHFKYIDGRKDLVCSALSGETMVYCYPYNGINEVWGLEGPVFTRVYEREKEVILFEGEFTLFTKKGNFSPKRYFKIKKDVIEYCHSKERPFEFTGVVPISSIIYIIYIEKNTGINILFKDDRQEKTITLLSDNIDCINKAVECIKSLNEKVSIMLDISPEEKYSNIKKHILEIVQFVDYIDINPGYKERIINVLMAINKTIKYSEPLYDEFDICWELLKGSFKFTTSSFNQDPKLQASVRRFAEIYNMVCPSKHKDILEKAIKRMTPEGLEEHKKLLSREDISSNIFNEKELNITYRGKPKKVIVLSSFTHYNGNKYILVKDTSDNKKKTLFEGYVSYL